MSGDCINDDQLGAEALHILASWLCQSRPVLLSHYFLVDQAAPFLAMCIEQEVTGPDSLFNDSLSSSHSLLQKIEYILTFLAKVWLRSNSHSPAGYRSEESHP